jgi:hypothetical protein
MIEIRYFWEAFLNNFFQHFQWAFYWKSVPEEIKVYAFRLMNNIFLKSIFKSIYRMSPLDQLAQ